MSKKNTNFKPDERNEGGKNQIFDHMYKHQLTIINMKPIVKSQVKNVPKVVVAKKTKKKNFHEYDEVIESFKRASNVKGNNLSNKPETFEIKSMLAKKTNKGNDFIKKEHEINLKNQKKRINSLSSMKERKKNHFDPVANPVYFLRKPQSPLNEISLVPYYVKLGYDTKDLDTLGLLENKENQKNNYAKNSSLNHKKTEKKSSEKINTKLDYKDLKKKANFSKYERMEPTGLKKTKKIEATFICAPTILGDSDDDYIELKRKLLNLIIENRLYKEEDLEDLFERTSILNGQLDKERLDEIFKFLIEELEK